MFVALTVTGIAAASWFYRRGYTLYYGDAEAHFNIARRILDSRHPGYPQIGTVWLPFPHLITALFAQNTAWWSTGLAAPMAGVICFVLAGTFLFASARRFLGSTAAAVVTTAVFALNPNLLYLQSTPMTEPVFFACACGLLYCTVVFAESQSVFAVIGAGLFSFCASWTRYDGWWLIPAVAAYFLIVSKNHRWRDAFLFGLIASLAPLLWFFHNWLNYGNALEFYNGPDSAIGIYKRGLARGFDYPGHHDWGLAYLYLKTAARLTSGAPFLWMGLAGLVAALAKRIFWPVVLLGLAPIFYVLSIYSSGTPIHVPELWPHSYYNTRYGLCILPLLAVGAGAIVAWVPVRLRAAIGLLVVTIAVVPWLAYPRAENWICWKESQVNSVENRQWMEEAGEFMKANYRPGDGIFVQFGDDLAGIVRRAGIPLRETLNMGDSPHWMLAQNRPDLFLSETWAIARPGDMVQLTMQKAMKAGQYRCVKIVSVKGAAAIEIYRRQLPAPARLP